MNKKSEKLLQLTLVVAFLMIGAMMLPSFGNAQKSLEASAAPDSIDLLYFHRTDRCQSCNNAEQFARDTLTAYFADDLKSGKLTIKSIDYQKDKTMAEKYGAKMQGLKLRIMKGGQETVKDLPELWAYVKDKDTYMGYLKNALDKELGK